jgi:hypothetical protein
MNKRKYQQLTSWCEHCDDGQLVRKDYLRGFVCKHCDCSLDEMQREEQDIATFEQTTYS